MPKEGTEYELFVKEIYKRLNAVDGLSDVKIRHDKANWCSRRRTPD